MDEASKKRCESWIQPDHGLYSLGAFIYWQPGTPTVSLDGEFTVEELEWVTAYIRRVKYGWT